MKAISFLFALADECEKCGTEYSKGRAQGIREAVGNLGPQINKMRDALQWIADNPAAHSANMVNVAEEAMKG